MPIPNPDDPTTSEAYVDPQGYVRVKAGINGPSTAVGVVGFVPDMCMLWKGLAAVKPKGWVIESAPAGSYLKIASSDGEMGATGGSATSTAPDHVHTIAHTHSHTHIQNPHSHSHHHSMAHHHTHPHDHTIDHNHPSEFSTEAVDGLSNSFETGDALAGVTQEYALKPHIHETFTATFVQDSGPVQNESWTMDNDVAGEADNSVYSETDATAQTATNQSDATASSAANSGVVAPPIVVAVTPLFYGLYLIRYTGEP